LLMLEHGAALAADARLRPVPGLADPAAIDRLPAHLAVPEFGTGMERARAPRVDTMQ